MTDPMHRLVRALIIDKGKILLCRSASQKHPFYFLPGGHVEQGESDQNALIRELYEETGYVFEIGSLLWDFEYQFYSEKKTCHTHERNIIFSAISPNMDSSKVLVQCEDHILLEWVDGVSLLSIDLKPESLSLLIQDVFQNKKINLLG